MAFVVDSGVGLWNETTGYPTPGLNTTRFSVSFAKLPNLQVFANKIDLPQITLGVANQPSPLLTFKHTGEKLEYSPFTVSIIVDSQMAVYKEIYNWMLRLSTQGLNSDTLSNCVLTCDAATIEFINVFPMSIGPLQFDSRQTDIQYPSIDVEFSCDRYTIT
jgi:hypothetical protein